MVNSLEQLITEFKEHYRTKVVEGIGSFSEQDIKGIAEMIMKAVRTSRNTIYIFGNGGSYAIGKHFGASLKSLFRGKGYGIRTNYGINFDGSQQLALEYGYEHIFGQILRDEQANLEDLVILISGSGNSENVVNAAKYCSAHNIPNISFSGFDGGEIARRSSRSLVARINDQQISEDIIQSLLHLCIKSTEGDVPKEKCTLQIKSGFDRLSPTFLDNVTDSVVKAYLNGRGVYVLAPEGNGLSISAEHTAHNLNWDVIYGIENPPARNVYSTPTNSDYSGIGNDRVAEGIVTIQQLERAKKGDVLVLYAQDTEKKAVKKVITYAEKKRLEIYVVSGTGNADVVFGTEDQFVTADLMQMTGHMIGRIANYKLKQSIGNKVCERDLIENDLAQRRLIGEKDGL